MLRPNGLASLANTGLPNCPESGVVLTFRRHHLLGKHLAVQFLLSHLLVIEHLFERSQLIADRPIVRLEPPRQLQVDPGIGMSLETHERLAAPEQALDIRRIEHQCRVAVLDDFVEFLRLQAARSQVELALTTQGDRSFDRRRCKAAAGFAAVFDQFQIVECPLETTDGECDVVGDVELDAAGLVLLGSFETLVDFQVVDVGRSAQRF